MFGLEIPIALGILLIVCVICVLGFEFINGFHDTANAVATVIYTNSLKPQTAVTLSAILNFLGLLSALIFGLGVAMSIINLLPIETLVSKNVWESVGMVMAILLTAIIWNLGTWWFGIPCSSSHTLIGSILGVAIAYAYFVPDSYGVVNWGKAIKIGKSLLIAPIIGLSLAAILMFILRQTVKDESFFNAPEYEKTPTWIRAVLILTCSGVSFAHGANDGQKGVGLMMLVLIGIVPATFSLNQDLNPKEYKEHVITLEKDIKHFNLVNIDKDERVEYEKKYKETQEELVTLKTLLSKDKLENEDAFKVRKNILFVSRNVGKLLKADKNLSNDQKKAINTSKAKVEELTNYAPTWVIVVISIALGLGTMIGWKRIAVTIGEKIGKEHLSYAQGASAELIAAMTIAFSSFVFKLPVSTTHILSSGVAGTMVAKSGAKNLQPATIKSIALAWVLTLPVCVAMAGGLFLLFRLFL